MTLVQWLDKYATRFGWAVVGALLIGILLRLLGNYWYCLAMISAMAVLALAHLVASKINKVHLISAVLWTACVVFWICTLPPRP